MARWPDRHELVRLRERWDLEDQNDIQLNDFDTTLTTGIEGTINQLGIFATSAKTSHSVEAENLRLQAVQELKDEVKQLRDAHAAVVQTLNTKASKGLQRKFELALTAKFEKKLDNLFKLVGFLGVAIGIIVAVKGH